MFCSLVGDPKTAITIVSHWDFLKFIPVMSNIQRMDAPFEYTANPCGSELARDEVGTFDSDGD